MDLVTGGSPSASEPIAWTGGELLALRGWRLFRSHVDGSARLLSMVNDAEWPGPVFVADRAPAASPINNNGVYAMKPRFRPRRHPRDPGDHALDWLAGREAWVWGWVSLSGTVVEHRMGYRARRAVIRQLRLGPQACASCEGPEGIAALIAELEERYQCRVKCGPWDRRVGAKLRELPGGRRRTVPEKWAAGSPPSMPPVPWTYTPPPPPEPRRRGPRGVSRDGLVIEKVVRAFRRAESELGTDWPRTRDHTQRRVTLSGAYSRFVRPKTKSWQSIYPGFPQGARFYWPYEIVRRAARILRVRVKVLVGSDLWV